MHVITVQPDGFPEWDAFVERSRHGLIYHSSHWRRILEASFPHIRGHFFALFDDQRQQIVAGLPVYRVKSRLLGNRLVSVPFASICDPLADSAKDMSLLLDAVLDFLRENGDASLEVRSCFNDAVLLKVGLTGTNACYHHYLSLPEDPQALLQGVDRDVARCLRLAGTSELHLREAESQDDIEAFYGLYLITRRRLRLPPMPMGFFRHLWTDLKPLGAVSLVFAEYQGRPVSAVVVLKSGRSAVLEFLADDGLHRRLHPNHAVYWHTMKQAAIEGYGRYSLGRTHHENASLRAFKESWGAQRTEMMVYYHPAGRAGDRDGSAVYSAVRLLSGAVPPALFRALGAFCYRHLG